MRCFFYTCLKPDITYLVHLEQIILIKFFKLKMNNLNVAMADRERLYNSLQNLTLYSLGDIRDILILVHYFFTGKIEDLFHEPLIEYTENLSKTIEQIKIDNLLSQNYDPEIYLFLYENKILEYVKNGDIRNLENMVFNLSNGIIPSVSGDTIRSEKIILSLFLKS